VIAAWPLELRLSLLALYDDYGAAIDDDLERWPDFFTPNAVYRVVARENFERGRLWPTMWCEGRGMMADRVTAIRRTSVYVPRQKRHFFSCIRITGETSEGWNVQAHFLVGESTPDGESRVFAMGRSIDVVVRDGDGPHGLRFAEKTCVYDGNLIQSSLIYPL
jgi:3-phenylpropionate/cinnamic acid dioxygenase small subunit